MQGAGSVPSPESMESPEEREGTEPLPCMAPRCKMREWTLPLRPRQLTTQPEMGYNIEHDFRAGARTTQKRIEALWHRTKDR